MIRKVIKKMLPEKRLEKVFRAKQYFKDAKLLKGDLAVLPPVNIRIKDEVIKVSPVRDLTLKGWKNIVNLYEKATGEEKQQFESHIKLMILQDASCYHLLQTRYAQQIFANHETLYLELLGTALYAAGKPEQAFEQFKKASQKATNDFHYLHMARCLMVTERKGEVIGILKQGLEKNPGSPVLLLSMANAHFRNNNIALANEALGKLSADFKAYLKSKSHNIDVLDAEIKEALKNKTIVRPIENLGFQAYTEDSVLYYWETLFFHFVNRSRFQHGWSDLCYITEKKMADYITQHPDIKNVLNFGVFCGVPDYNLSLRFPGVNFIGVDREQSTKQYNDTAFVGKNISFHAMDMLDLIYDDRQEVRNYVSDMIKKHGDMMIFHARTTTLIYPEAVRKFYKGCAAAGVKYISLYENAGLSRYNLQYYDFDNMPADTIPYYSVMQIHNYKKFLEEAGYEIVDKEIWNYSDLLWEGKDLYGTENYLGLGDGHVALLAKLK